MIFLSTFDCVTLVDFISFNSIKSVFCKTVVLYSDGCTGGQMFGQIQF